MSSEPKSPAGQKPPAPEPERRPNKGLTRYVDRQLLPRPTGPGYQTKG